MDITQHAMLVNVHLGVWQGMKVDKEASKASAREAGAGDENAFQTSKRLIAKELIDPVLTARNAIGTHTRDRTMPWDDNGFRLLPRKMYQTFINEHSVLEQAFFDRANDFVAGYTQARATQEFRLGTRFDPNDYPHPDDVRRRFYCTMDIAPVPTAGDFRVTLSESAIGIIKTQIEEATTQRIFAAQADVWRRIETTVTHFAGRLSAQLEEVPEGQRRPPLHQSTIDNLVHLVNALPALNITGDPGMKAVGRKLHGLLQTYNDADKMKGKPDVCSAAREDVQAIIEEMRGFSRAFTEVE